MASRYALLVCRQFGTSSICRKEMDLITSAYLSKIRAVVGKQNELLEGSQVKKELGDQLNRLAQKFHLSDADAVTKLNLQFEKANVVSSVDQLTEGQPIDALLKGLNESRVQYEAEQKTKKQAEQERLSSISGDADDYAKEFFPIPPPHIEAQQLAAAAKASA